MRNSTLCSPILSSLLESRTTCLALAGAGLLHVGAIATTGVGWPCPIRHTLGIPCPGCGLGRATALLLSGKVAESLHLHAFAPFAVAGITLVLLGAILPERQRQSLAVTLMRLERRLPIAPLLLAAALIYWLARLALDGRGFLRLVT